jgi:hypothetical protein
MPYPEPASKGWKRPQEIQTISVKGGLLKRGCSLTLESKEHPTTRDTYVNFKKSDKIWRTAVCGSQEYTGFAAVTLFSRIRDKLDNSETRATGGGDAMMDALMDGESGDEGGGRGPPPKKAKKVTLAEAELPLHPYDPDGPTRTLKLWLQHNKTRVNVWIDLDSVPWALDFMRCEVESGGVDPIAEDGPATPTSQVRWSFQRSQWDLIGPGGVVVSSLGPADLTPEKCGVPAEELASASPEWRKEMARDVVERELDLTPESPDGNPGSSDSQASSVASPPDGNPVSSDSQASSVA